MKSAFYLAVQNVFSQNALPLEPTQAALFEELYNLVTEKNQVMNLTRITEPEEAAKKHFFDSVSILKYLEIKQNTSIADIGTGAGFPGLPLKIIRPDLSLTLIDSSEKKINFVSDAAKHLNLDVQCVAGRAEELCIKKPYRENFDIAVSRAVASLPVLLELCTPYVKQNGPFIAYKGADYEAELSASKNAMKQLHLTIKNIYFPYTERSHALLVFQKLQQTPKAFPRKFAVIKKKPL